MTGRGMERWRRCKREGELIMETRIYAAEAGSLGKVGYWLRQVALQLPLPVLEESLIF